MRFALLTNIVSPHQLPLARALVDRVGNDNFRYIATEMEHRERTRLGWHIGDLPDWVISSVGSAEEQTEAQRWCEEADVVLSGLREFDLFRRRAGHGLKNLYMSERWFKPPRGAWRMLHPGYRRMARQFRDLLRDGSLTYLPMGIHAARDMVRISDLLRGKVTAFFRQPRVTMTNRQPLAQFVFANERRSVGPSNTPCRKPCRAPGSNSTSDSKEPADLLHTMRLWGYFVEPGEEDRPTTKTDRSSAACDHPLRVLWVGRMLDWKRVDTLVKAVVRLLDEGATIRLILVGYGPEKEKLQRLAGRHLLADANDNTTSPGIVFREPVPIRDVRGLMRESDVFVLSSDGGEGWGAAVNEAMAEGCSVIGTHEAGSSATMIEHGVNGWLYPAGNVNALADLLRQCNAESVRTLGDRARETLATSWSPDYAAEQLLAYARKDGSGSGHRSQRAEVGSQKSANPRRA